MTFTLDTSEQLIIVSASASITVDIVHSSNAKMLSVSSQSRVEQARMIVTVQYEPATCDTAYDAVAVHSPSQILCGFPVICGGQKTASLRYCARPGGTVTVALESTCPMTAIALAHCSVHLTGSMIRGLPEHAGWRPVLHHKWFMVKPSVRRVSGSASLRAGEVGEVHAVSTCGGFVKWDNRTVTPMSELLPYRKVFTAARADKVVRIRRFPHRHADIIGEVKNGESKAAIGQVLDPVDKELYVLWEDGGWSRLGGTSGPFLIEHRLADCVVFPEPKLFSSVREGRGVRVRSEPNLTSKQVGSMEPNEVREASALHTDANGNQFVQWVVGGFSCVGGLHGNFLMEITPVGQTLRSHPLRGSRPPPSPAVVSLDRLKKRPREDNIEDDNAALDPSLRRAQLRPRDVGVSPGLVPQHLKDDVRRGQVNLTSLPKMSLNGDGEGVASDSDSEEEDSDDVTDYSTEDFDEDALDTDYDDEEEFTDDFSESD